jgi:hypothetical protein
MERFTATVEERWIVVPLDARDRDAARRREDSGLTAWPGR